MRERISVFGLGYVGSVTAASLAHKGYQVIGVDVNPQKTKTIADGHSPIVEPRMEELVAAAHAASTLTATDDVEAAVQGSDISFICVGTPGQRNGKLDLRYVEHVCQEIGQGLRRKSARHVVVVRSTVLPGTSESVVIPLLESSSGKRQGRDFTVCMNPEFMREGTAVNDFLQPAMTIVGGSTPEDAARLRKIYSWAPGRVFETSLRTAEMVKYACNVFHALKIAFANELGTICKELGAATDEITEIFVSDTKLNISPSYLKPGFAFGGSCLPKDLRAISHRTKELDLNLPLFQAILPSNEEHIERALRVILGTGKREIAFLGLSFKSETDDLRESPSVQMIKRLLGEGCQIQVWDKSVAMGRLIGSNKQFIDDTIPHIGSLLCDSLEQVLEHAQVVVLATSAVSKEALEGKLRSDQIVVDLMNLSKAQRVARSAYAGICW